MGGKGGSSNFLGGASFFLFSLSSSVIASLFSTFSFLSRGRAFKGFFLDSGSLGKIGNARRAFLSSSLFSFDGLTGIALGMIDGSGDATKSSSACKQKGEKITKMIKERLKFTSVLE